MNRRRFEEAVDRVLEDLPDWVLDQIDNLIVVVEETAPPEHDPTGELLGLYEGTSLLDRSGDYWGGLPDQITIYRQPHLHLGLGESELVQEIRRTVLHELGHYLGFDETRLHALGWD